MPITPWLCIMKHSLRVIRINVQCLLISLLFILSACNTIIKTRLVIDPSQNPTEVIVKYKEALEILNEKMAPNHWIFVLSQVNEISYDDIEHEKVLANMAIDAYAKKDYVSIYYTSHSCYFYGLAPLPFMPEEYRYGILLTADAPPTILSHEMGHYFGLYHPHQEGGDFVDDTPSTADIYYPNVMAYSYSPDVQFTPGQLERMRIMLRNYRKELLK